MVAARVVDTGGVVMETKFVIASVAVVVSGTVVIAASVIIIGATDEDAEGMFVEDKVVVAIFSVMSVVFDDAASLLTLMLQSVCLEGMLWKPMCLLHKQLLWCLA